jgi:chromosome segregation ATPase
LAASVRRCDEAQRELSVAGSARAEAEQRTIEMTAALEQAEETIASLRSVMGDERARIDALTKERDALLPLESRLAERTDELGRKEKELERARELAAAERETAQAQLTALTQERDRLLELDSEVEERSSELARASDELVRTRAELDTVRAALAEVSQVVQQREVDLDAMRSRLREQSQALRSLEHTLATRDELADQLRSQLQTAQDERAIVSSQLEKARRRVKVLTQEVFRRDHRIGELRTELTVHTEALAAIRRDVNRIGQDEEAMEERDEIERVLEPVDHTGPSIVLSGKMLTVGRTAESDVCIPSKLVSRHHARLLVGPNGVIIEDAGSTNGCYVNGKQVRKHLIQEGDVLELGDLRYRLQTRSPQDTKIRANVIPIFEPRPQ